MKFFQLILFVGTLLMASSTVAFSQEAVTVSPADSVETAKIKVKGITCGVDLNMISTNVTKLKGVSTCEVAKQGPTSTLKITFNPKLVTRKKINEAIEGTGACDDPNARPYKVKQ